MNIINPNFLFTPQVMQKLLLFCSENSYQHIDTILNSVSGTGANLEQSFKDALSSLNASFKNIYAQSSEISQVKRLSSQFLAENQKFIFILERLKFEAFGGYPILNQNIFHYLFEQRYFNQLFLNSQNNYNVLITTRFNAEFKLSKTYLLYNNIYFWSIIGAIHPGTLLSNSAFVNSINKSVNNRLYEFRNNFNRICYKLTASKNTLNQNSLNQIYSEFKVINAEFLELLHEIKSHSSTVFLSNTTALLPASFKNGIEHMISEHTAVKKIGEFDLSRINIPN